MIEVIQGMPANVIGLNASGEVTREDYQQVVVPAIDDKQKQFDKIRLMYILGPGFEGYSGNAMLEDSKLVFKHPGSWEKIAVVSDDEWIRRGIALFGWMVPGEVKLFPNSETAEAKSWVTD